MKFFWILFLSLHCTLLILWTTKYHGMYLQQLQHNFSTVRTERIFLIAFAEVIQVCCSKFVSFRYFFRWVFSDRIPFSKEHFVRCDYSDIYRIFLTVSQLWYLLPQDFYFRHQQSLDILEPTHIWMDRISIFLSNWFRNFQSKICRHKNKKIKFNIKLILVHRSDLQSVLFLRTF